FRQHAGQTAYFPRGRKRSRHRSWRAGPGHPDQPRRFRERQADVLRSGGIAGRSPAGRPDKVSIDVILILNAGSSSLKFCLYDATGGEQHPPLARGEVSGIGRHPALSVNGGAGKPLPSATGHAEAGKEVLDWIRLNAEGWRVIA